MKKIFGSLLILFLLSQAAAQACGVKGAHGEDGGKSAEHGEEEV